MDGNTVKKEFYLDGLGCANCANKIEEKVKGLEGVSSCKVNFVTKTLYMEVDAEQQQQIIQEASKHAGRIEAGLKVIDKASHNEHEHKHSRSTGHSHGHNHEHDYEHDHEHDHEHSHAHAHGHAHSHDHHHNDHAGIKDNSLFSLKNTRILAGILLFLIVTVVDIRPTIELSVYIGAYLFIGGDVVYYALRNLIGGNWLDENFLMSIATVGAFLIGEYPEAVSVMIFYQVGEAFQDHALHQSRKSIKALLDIKAEYANLVRNGEVIKVEPEEVQIGDVILIKPGEKVPLDGIVTEGESFVDTAALTGESVPRNIGKDEVILSGYVNLGAVLTVRVTKEFADSTVAKILELVENASNHKAVTENFITRFAKYYTPVVVIAAFLIATLPLLLFENAVFSDWLYRALIFLVVSCPCALVISIPLGFFGGIGGASRHGILVKGGNYLEVLNQVDTIVFDKTGTLTKGVFRVNHIETYGEYSESEILTYAASVEQYSNHPIAKSINTAFELQATEQYRDLYQSVKDMKEISGYGVEAIVSGKKVLVGNLRFLKENFLGQELKAGLNRINETIVYVGIEGQLAGAIHIADEIKKEAKVVISDLKNIGIKRIIMLTGDKTEVAKAVSEELGINEYYAQLLPQEKVEYFEALYQNKSNKSKIAFVGDGINDAPVLARADVGIAMGGLGSDAAIEAADVVIMNDELSRIVHGVQIAGRTKVIVWQNIIFALTVKALVLILGVFGLASMWGAVFADVGVALLAVFNAMRVMKFKPR